MGTKTTDIAADAATFAQLARDGGWSVSFTGDRCTYTGKVIASAYIVEVHRQFTPGDVGAYIDAERDANELMRLAPMTNPGSVWGTDSGSVGGHHGLTTGHMRLSKSGISGRFMRAAAKACGTELVFRAGRN